MERFIRLAVLAGLGTGHPTVAICATVLCRGDEEFPTSLGTLGFFPSRGSQSLKSGAEL